MPNTTSQENRLIHEKSPYLLQHANNPVNWYPWGQEAFANAKSQNKPIFLSIGYSTCHWCHVMERESFEDQEVAELLNQSYIAIKVDREERPDIDHIYMSVCQGITGSGGWPLTIIMTPDKQPFFAGTYFPKHSHYGRPGLMDILTQLSDRWQDNPKELIAAGKEITDAVTSQLFTHQAGKLAQDAFDKAYSLLTQSFDAKYGGFGQAPKFPTPHTLSFLLRYYRQKKEPRALSMIEKTLEAMADGGIYDHIGFGFARYSTDRKWLVPHFEKMLYDNAQIAYVLLEAYQVTGKERYAHLAEEIFAYVLRDMTSTEGGFYSAEDADTEGVEGKFYVWTPAEVIDILGQDLGSLFCRVYDISQSGNFEGKNIPNLIGSDLTEIARQSDLTPTLLQEKLSMARNKLWQAREKRVHPHKDDKILTAWNGLMIAALAKGAQVLGNSYYAQVAAKAVRFFQEKLITPQGRLLARFRDGDAAYPAYIDDYAFLIWGLIELYHATFEVAYLEFALSLNADLMKYFWDEDAGGLFMYGSDSEQLLTRPKEVYDGATPSGNSVAALNLLRLARLTGKPELEEQAGRIFNAFAGNINNYPPGYTFMLQALWFSLTPGLEIVIAGDREDAVSQRMLQLVQTKFLPEAVLMLNNAELAKLVPAVAEQKQLNNRSTAYVCQNFACQAPTTDPAALANLLH